MTIFAPATPAQRELATMFVGRVAQLDAGALVRVVTAGCAVQLWAKAGFGVLATQTVAARIEPSPLTVYATDFVGALAVSTSRDVDPGRDVGDLWRVQLPPPDGWADAGRLDPEAIAATVRAGLVHARLAMERERENEIAAATKATVPPALLDSAMMTVPSADGRIPISMRMLFALSGMGLVDRSPDDSAAGPIRVRTTPTWLRLDADAGAVARRRMADLPLDEPRLGRRDGSATVIG